MTAGIDAEARRRFRIGCMMLRTAGQLDFKDLPAPGRAESIIDWLVRVGIAQNQLQALEGLLLARGTCMVELRDEIAAGLLGPIP